jgi:CheY-like chemotaxis protein
VNESKEVPLAINTATGARQNECLIANPAGRCYKSSAMSEITNLEVLGTRQESAEPSMLDNCKSVLSASSIMRSIMLPPKAAREPRVLIIDDDPAIAPLVSAALDPFHVCADSVTSGATAIICLHSRWYNLVVLDLMLGDLHGFEILRHLKADRRFTETKVLVLTADSRLEALARSFGHGADDFVKKPFAVKELGMRAFRLLDRSRWC